MVIDTSALYPPLALKRAIDFLTRTAGKFPFERLSSHEYELADIDRAFAEADHFGGESVTRAAIVSAPGGTA